MPSAPIFVSGIGRTSVRAVAQVINHSGALRDVFEPFDNVRNRECKRFRLGRYLRPRARDADLMRPANRILTGELQSAWSDQFNAAPRDSPLVIRECRSNLWLGWLHSAFPFVKIVFVIRHPCAVAESRRLVESPTRLRRYLAQPELLEDLLGPYKTALLETDDPFERHVYSWCVEHFAPFAQLAADDCHVLFYEDLIATPVPAARGLFEFLGDPAGIDSVESIAASPEMRERRAVLDVWRKRVDDAHRARARAILRRFGMGALYREDETPDREAALRLFARTTATSAAAPSA